MRKFNDIINEESEKLSRDFEVGINVLSKQTKTWLKQLDSRVDQLGLSYDKCRSAAKQFKNGDFEGALKTIWGKKLEIDIVKSENGGNQTVKTYTVGEYAVFTEKIGYKNDSFVHSITGKYTEVPTPGFSLGTVINVYGKSEGSDIELIEDRKTREALSMRNTANIYNILFVGCDIHSKFLSKPMLKLKKSL